MPWTFQLGGSLGGAERRKACLTQRVARTGHQGDLRADHDEVCLHLAGDVHHFEGVLDIAVSIRGDLRRTSVARGNEQFMSLHGLSKSMFPATGTDNKDAHGAHNSPTKARL